MKARDGECDSGSCEGPHADRQVGLGGGRSFGCLALMACVLGFLQAAAHGSPCWVEQAGPQGRVAASGT